MSADRTLDARVTALETRVIQLNGQDQLLLSGVEQAAILTANMTEQILDIGERLTDLEATAHDHVVPAAQASDEGMMSFGTINPCPYCRQSLLLNVHAGCKEQAERDWAGVEPDEPWPPTPEPDNEGVLKPGDWDPVSGFRVRQIIGNVVEVDTTDRRWGQDQRVIAVADLQRLRKGKGSRTWITEEEDSEHTAFIRRIDCLIAGTEGGKPPSAKG